MLVFTFIKTWKAQQFFFSKLGGEKHKWKQHFSYHSFFYFFSSGGASPLYPEICLQYYTMILQRPKIIVEDAGFEPSTSAREVL